MTIATASPNIDAYLKRHETKSLLRFITCGSVDDGKSTLIGRLLYDTKLLLDDQLATLESDSVRHGTQNGELDFALLVDGLAAEREQGITIDVAYRYFATPKRRFIIADTPGHVQYTRNMATGASTANLALILIDARKGVLPQTKRHAFISSLLGIRHVVVVVNKMDLVGWSQERYEEIRRAFSDFAARLDLPDLRFVPVSALVGDNVVHRSANTPWYEDVPLLTMLETVHVASDRNLIDLRYPVQFVTRAGERRRYLGQVASGVVRPGDEVLVLPSRRRTRVTAVESHAGALEAAFPPQSVAVTLADEVDVSRGELLVHPQNQPRVARRFEAMVVWMTDAPLCAGARYLVKHLTQTVPVRIEALRYAVDVETLRQERDPGELGLNGIGRVAISAQRALFLDPYRKNRATGALILIDPATNATAGAAMVIDREPEDELPAASDWDEVDDTSEVEGALEAGSQVAPEERARRLGQRPLTVWLTGLPGSGARAVARAAERLLFEAGGLASVLDGAALRRSLSHELDFGQADTREHLRRASALARVLNDAGLITLCSFVSPRAADRERVAQAVGDERFCLVHVASPRAWCEANDEKGVYARASAGELRNVPGVNAPYEAPDAPDLVLRPDETGVEAAAGALVELLRRRGVLSAGAEGA